MERGKASNVVSETWGRAAVFSYDPANEPEPAAPEQPEILYTSNAYLRTTASSISQEIADLNIPEIISVVPIEGLSLESRPDGNPSIDGQALKTLQLWKRDGTIRSVEQRLSSATANLALKNSGQPRFRNLNVILIFTRLRRSKKKGYDFDLYFYGNYEETDEHYGCSSVSSMPLLLSYLYATLLEDVIAQMWILERCNNELNISKTLFDMDNFLAIKFDIKKSKLGNEELADIDPVNLNSITYKIKKLDADRKYINNVIQSTYLDLAQSLHFTPLVKFIREIEFTYRYRAELEEEESKNRILRKELSRQVRQQRNHIKTVVYDTDVNIDRLRTQVEDSVLLSEVRSRYIENWQQARAEQNNQVISDIESVPGDKIANYKLRSDQENRVHAEVELLVNIAINETLAKVEEWMDKYDTDMENIDLKIQIKKNDYQNMRDKRTELEETLAKHELQMKEWIKFKADREEKRRYIELMTNSAIIVQAWWRGLLVRLQLGPFKVKKPKKGPPKKLF